MYKQEDRGDMYTRNSAHGVQLQGYCIILCIVSSPQQDQTTTQSNTLVTARETERAKESPIVAISHLFMTSSASQAVQYHEEWKDDP